MADLYHDHFATVDAAVGRAVTGADKETVIHEVFFKLIDAWRVLRQSFGLAC